jgi:hypothetical protein
MEALIGACIEPGPYRLPPSGCAAEGRRPRCEGESGAPGLQLLEAPASQLRSSLTSRRWFARMRRSRLQRGTGRASEWAARSRWKGSRVHERGRAFSYSIAFSCLSDYFPREGATGTRDRAADPLS